MKKGFLIMLGAMVLGATPAMAASDTYDKPGTMTAQAGVGLFWGGLGGQIQGGADLAVYQVPIAPQFPLDLGASGRVSVGTAGLALGAFGTAHYSWKALRSGVAWVDKLETYLGLGLVLIPVVGLDSFGGVAYHIDSRWAVYAEGGIFGTVLGAQYRF